MRRLLYRYDTYQTILAEVLKETTLDIIPIRKGDEFFLWKDEQSVLDFFKYWDTEGFRSYTGGYKQPVVKATASTMESMVRVTDTEHPPMLYVVLFREPQPHPLYNQYIGYGVEHTNVIRTTKTEYGINIIKTDTEGKEIVNH